MNHASEKPHTAIGGWMGNLITIPCLALIAHILLLITSFQGEAAWPFHENRDNRVNSRNQETNSQGGSQSYTKDWQ